MTPLELLEFTVRLLLAVVAVTRVSSILVHESIAQPLREKAGIWHDASGKRISHNDSFFGELLWCYWCTSVWVGSFYTLALILPWWAFVPLTIPFVLSWGAIYLYEKKR